MRVTRNLVIAGCVVFLSCMLLEFWLFEFFVRLGVKDQTALRKRNQVRGIYLDIPFPFTFNIYFFNVTNPDETQKGAIPELKEIGPYSYDEYKHKIDVVDSVVEDSLEYTPYDIYKFNQNKSGQLKEDDTVTILHPLIVGMVNQVLRDSPVYASIVNKSLTDLFNNPKDIFLTAKVKDILFDGLEINCKSKEFAITAVCSQMKSQIPGLKTKPGEPKIFLFSLLGQRNATKSKRVKVLRGISQSSDLGRVLSIDGKKELNLWSTRECNQYNGTDGWIFPPLLAPEEGLKAYSTDLCRNMKMEYINETTFKKLNLRIYEADLGDQTSNEAEKCYCRTPTTCLKKGLFDLSKCMGVPIFATLPHFLNADESYLKKVKGLQPDSDKHILRVYFEPITGCPIKGAIRMQFNFDVRQTNKVWLFSNLSEALFPLLWIEDTVTLEGELLKKIQTIFLLRSVAHDAIISICVLSFAATVVALYYYNKNQNKIEISPVQELKVSNKGTSPISRIGEDSAKTKVLSGHAFDKY